MAYIPNSTQRASLITRSRLHSYKQSTRPQNRVGKHRITAETRIDADKNMCETIAIKIGPKISSSHHRHFTKHLADILKNYTENPPTRNYHHKTNFSSDEVMKENLILHNEEHCARNLAPRQGAPAGGEIEMKRVSKTERRRVTNEKST
jgi:hypothetical protein